MRRAASHFFAPARTSRIVRTLVRRFTYRKDGAAAVEFGIVVVPFFALLFAIIETAMFFWASQTLETAVGDSGRLIMTGQAQALYSDAASYKNAVCGKIYGLFNCQAGLQVDVKPCSSWGACPPAPPVNANGEMDTSGFTYQACIPCQICVVRFAYKWPTFVRTFGLDLADLGGVDAGYRLMLATTVFRTEPYSVGAGSSC